MLPVVEPASNESFAALPSQWTPVCDAKRVGKYPCRSAMEVTFTPHDTGGIITHTLDGVPGAGHLEFHRPNCMVLHIPMGDKREMRFSVPEKVNRTRLIVVTKRSFAVPWPLTLIFDRLNRRIVEEDRAIVESSSPPEVPPLGVEKSVGSDRATLFFRKYYHTTFKKPLP